MIYRHWSLGLLLIGLVGFAPAVRSDAVEPTGPLSLRDAVAAALVGSPSLAAYSAEVRIREAEALQAGLRPNPELDIELENFAGSGKLGGFDGSETTVVLSHIIELGGKRGARRTLADRARDLAEWDYEIARIDALTRTTTAYVDVLAAQRAMALAGELVTIADDEQQAVARRVRAGSTSPVEASRANVELEMSRIDHASAERALEIARTALAATWGSGRPQFDSATGSLDELPPVPALDTLLDRIDHNPELLRWARERGVRRAAADHERAAGRPDLSVTTGLRTFGAGDDVAFVLGVGVPLPLFNRNQGAARAASLRIEQADAEQRAATLRIQTELRIAHADLLAAEAEITALRDRAVPEARRAFASAEVAYRRGSLRFTDVLDTKRLLSHVESRTFDALVRYHRAVATIEQLTGAPIDGTRDSERM